MSEKFKDKIQKASWKIEELLEEVRENLFKKTRQLSPKKRRKLPKFSGLWKEKNLKSYLERLQEAIEKPRIARSRQLLNGIGVSCEGLPKETLEDVEQIAAIHKLFNQLKNDLGKNMDVLIEKKVLREWLNEGTARAVGNLQSAIDAIAGFKRLVKLKGLSVELRRQLLKEAFEDLELISKADELNSQIIYISAYEINVEYHDGKLNELLEDCEIVYKALKEFETIYKISTNEVTAWAQGKNLQEIRKCFEGGEDPFSITYANLRRRWRELTSILEEESPEPEGFPDLKKEVRKLETRFRESLGNSGLRLLGFFRGESDFPVELSKEELVTVLRKLQPFFTIGFKEENHG